MTHHKRKTCRACDGVRLDRFLELGPTPLANSFLRGLDEIETEQSYPLDVYRCETCSLVQLLDVIDPEVLFRNYIYVTGTSETMAHHNRAYARAVTEALGLGAGDLVAEVASNDGSLLACFDGVSTLGIEPARNIAELAHGRGIDTVCQFFGLDVARRLRSERGSARVVIANNVLAHVDDTRDFLAGCAEWVDDAGRVVVEVPYLGALLEGLEYDTIYHEHLCYFSVMALMRLTEAVGLVIVSVDHMPVHGGSLRVWTARRSDARPEHAADVQALADRERQAGFASADRYRDFASAVLDQRRSLRALLDDLAAQGADVAGYGAPAKGNTLLNYCGIDVKRLRYIADRSPLKVDLLTPGTHIPVRSVEALEADPPDYLLILAWNFAEEIMRQQQGYAARGGRFILPLPEPRVVAT